jgi:signal peptidase I
MNIPSVAFVTSSEYPDLLQDDLLVVEKLKQKNIYVEPVIWNDDTVDWNGFDAIVIRSPWDYFLKPLQYTKWIESFLDSDIKLMNPAKAILANIDKRYLLDLEKMGVAIIPTVYLTQGSSVQLTEIQNQHNWEQLVVKPVISGGAYGTWRNNSGTAEDDQNKLSEQLAVQSLLIQPFMPEIQSEGEWSIIYINGEYSHSVLKKAKGKDFRIQEEHGGKTYYETPDINILEQTQKIIDLQSQDLLYARVDGVVRNGQFLLMELEINEPSLFFSYSDSAVERFANAIENSIKK